MEDRTKKFLLGGAALLGSALFGWYFYEKKHHPQPVQRTNSISKSLWMQILKDQERESYPILKVISDLSKEYLEELNMMPTSEIMQQTLLGDYPVIDEKIAEIIKGTHERYGVSEEEYLYALTVTFKEDDDGINCMAKFAANLNNALMGCAPKLASKIPDFLTQEKTLEVVGKLNKVEEEKLIEYLHVLEKNPSLWANPPARARFFRDVRVQVRFSDEKRQVLVKEGLDIFAEAPERILDTAIAKYSAETPELKKEFEYLQRDTVDSFWGGSSPVSVSY